jgi:hypothetical protein
MQCPPWTRRSLACLFALGLFSCDKGGEDSTPPPADGADAGETTAKGPTHEVELPSPDEVCEHIVKVAHLELGHTDEMNPEGEAAALADCVKRFNDDRAKFGVAFAPIPECVFAAVTLEQIAECEDHYALDLVGDDAHTAVTELSLEEPIVDGEICMHWAHIATGKAVETTECRNELIKVREHVGNVLFDSFAKCMMDSKDEAEFFQCRTDADAAKAEKVYERPHEARVIADATPEDALGMLSAIEQQACACETPDCAFAARDALDMWVIAYADAGGTTEQSMDAERLVSSLVQCERDIAGEHWVAK